MEQAADPLRHLCAAYFLALERLQQAPAQTVNLLAQHMGLTPAEVRQALKGVHLFDLSANHALLGGPQPRLLEAMHVVTDIMLRHRLLRTAPKLDDALSRHYLPPLA